MHYPVLGAFYIKNTINNLQTMKVIRDNNHVFFHQYGISTIAPRYILCEPTEINGIGHVQITKHSLKKYQEIPTIEYDVFSAFQLLPPEAYFEYAKSLMKPYRED